MKKIDLSTWPFGIIVVLSLLISGFHGLLQLKWTAIRYRTFGPRPASAQAFVALEVLLLMVVLTVGMVHISDGGSTESNGRYYSGIAAAATAWIVVSFVL